MEPYSCDDIKRKRRKHDFTPFLDESYIVMPYDTEFFKKKAEKLKKAKRRK